MLSPSNSSHLERTLQLPWAPETQDLETALFGCSQTPRNILVLFNIPFKRLLKPVSFHKYIRQDLTA